MGMTAAWTSLGVCQMRQQAQKALATLPGTQRLLHTATLVIRLASPKATAYGSDSAVSWNNTERKFHYGLDVRSWHSHCQDTGLVPGWRTKIP